MARIVYQHATTGLYQTAIHPITGKEVRIPGRPAAVRLTRRIRRNIARGGVR